MSIGYINSFQSLGTVDGPGIRFVVFMQGCNLRCACCHNPDTWEIGVGETYTAQQVVDKIVRFKEYFGEEGGVTVSGGEPLLQAEFVKDLFVLCRENGINTCLDTSGSIINAEVLSLLDVTDRVLLDVKYTSNDLYEKYVGCSINTVKNFLSILQQKKVKTTVRQVIIPSINDTAENVKELKSIISKFSVVDGVELLAFKKICKVKYDKLSMPFRFENYPEPTAKKIEELNKFL